MATTLPDYIMRADDRVRHKFDGRTLDMLAALRKQFDEVNKAIGILKKAQKDLADQLKIAFPDEKPPLVKR